MFWKVGSEYLASVQAMIQLDLLFESDKNNKLLFCKLKNSFIKLFKIDSIFGKCFLEFGLSKYSKIKFHQKDFKWYIQPHWIESIWSYRLLTVKVTKQLVIKLQTELVNSISFWTLVQKLQMRYQNVQKNKVCLLA